MKIFYVPSELFKEMKIGSPWLTLHRNYEGLPILRGGLDHIAETKNQFVFHDIGCNGFDNSYIVRSQHPLKIPY